MKKRFTSIAVAAALAVTAALGGSASPVAGVAVAETTAVTPTQQLTSTNNAKPVHGDFDGDGRDDIFWYVAGSGPDFLWSGKARNDTNATTAADRFVSQVLSISGTYTPIVGDFNGDDRDDIFWYGPGTAPDSMWYFTGRGEVTSKTITINGTYTPVVGDFHDNDGLDRDDIFWYAKTGPSHLWTSSGSGFIPQTYALRPPVGAQPFVGNWRQSSTAPGAAVHEDILFYVPGTAADSIWVGDSAGGFTHSPVTINGRYSLIIGDFDTSEGPSMTDIFWYAPGRALDSVWMNTGSTFVSTHQVVNGTSYQPVVVPARGESSQDDIFWNEPKGNDYLWAMSGTEGGFDYTSLTPADFGGTNPGTRFPVVGDFDVADPSTAVVDGYLATGGGSACALTTAGGVECWGHGLDGRLGNGGTTSSSVPVPVTGLASGVTSVDAGWAHNCAVTTAATARCWGDNPRGQLGNGTTSDASTPITPTGLTNVAKIDGGFAHTCAQLANGSVRCFGDNSNGQLGNGTTTMSTTSVAVTGLSGVTDIGVSDTNNSSCAVAGGAAKCWGLNTYGQLGNGSTTQATTPVSVSGLGSGVAQVVAGANHACALTTGGAVKCWGLNASGQLGNGSTTSSSTPVNVTGLSSGVVAIDAGRDSTCALTSTNVVKCWGDVNAGGLVSLVPTDLATAGSRVVSIEAGWISTCVLTALGRTSCFGNNAHGQLGDGTTTAASTWTEVLGGRQFATGPIGTTVPEGDADILWWALGNTTLQTELFWSNLEGLG